MLAWSKKRNDVNLEQVFDGKVTSEMILYAAEFAPVLDFDSNGGNKLNALIARAGDAITLPTPTRENYTFKGWQDTSGNDFTAAVMPENSLKLTAVWWAQVALDGRGGGTFEAISQEAGTPLALPTPEKDGFIFAGWYNERNEKTELSVMPHESVKLKAMYYAVNTETLVILEDSIIEVKDSASYNAVFVKKANTRKIAFSAISSQDWQGTQQTRVKFHVKIRDAIQGGFFNGTFLNAYFKFFSINNTSSANLIGEYTFKNKESAIKDWKQLEFTLDMPITDGTAYFEFSAQCIGTLSGYIGYYGARISDMWAEMLIPDQTALV